MSETETPEPYLAWFGGLACLVFMATLVAVLAITNGWLHAGPSVPAVAAEPLTQSTPAVTNTTTCDELAQSEPRSPAELLWFHDNCTSLPGSLLLADTGKCNRKALDPSEFTLVAPELYVFRQTPGSRAYVWYSSSDTCFDLASGRVVAAICGDRTMVFTEGESACSPHGGVLAWVNGR